LSLSPTTVAAAPPRRRPSSGPSGDHPGLRPFPTRRSSDLRLRVQLQRQIPRRRVIHTEVHAQRTLIETREDVADAVAFLEVAEPLGAIVVLGDPGADPDIEPHRVYRRPGYSRGASMGLSSLARQ